MRFLGFQSSPGPKAGRYLAEFRAVGADTMFQSSPGPKAGRYLIRYNYYMLQKAFQSSPGPKAGRYRPAGSGLRSSARPCFNPRPARRPGATLVALDLVLRRVDVSILARPEGRALQRRGADRRLHHELSILARPEGRALPRGWRTPRTRRETSFNPRPARRPGATSPGWPRWPGRRARFQSSPGPKAGRYSPRPYRHGRRSTPCFNPRPARRPGATSCDRRVPA